MPAVFFPFAFAFALATATIVQTIPNRLAYFPDRGFDMYPVVSPNEPDPAQVYFQYAVGDTTFYSGSNMIWASDSVELGEHYYLRVHGIPCRPNPDTLRLAGAVVWRYGIAGDQIVYDFGAGDDSSYTVIEPYDFPHNPPVTVTVDTDIRVTVSPADTVAGRLFSFDNEMVLDEGCSYYFAEGLGVVYVSSDWGFRFRMEGTEVLVNGVPLTRDTQRAAVRLPSLYPNPAGDFVTFARPDSRDAVTVHVVDALGRTVRRLRLGAGVGEATIDIRDLAAGVYGVAEFKEGSVDGRGVGFVTFVKGW